MHHHSGMVDYALVRVVRGLLAGAALVAALLGASASPALAHAYLFRSDPAAGQVIARPPAAVTLTFSEPVQTRGASIAVYDGRLRRVDGGAPYHPGGSVNLLTVPLAGGLGRGTYTVVWRVVSVDSHPAAGDFTFAVGALSAVRGATPSVPRTGRLVGVTLGVARFVSYAGLAAGPGALLTVLLLWPAGRRDPRARRLVAAGLGALVVGSLAAYLVQGVYAAGLGLPHLVSAPALQAVGSSHYGHVVLARLYLAAASVVLAAPALRRRSLALDAVTLALGAAIALTFALAGHAFVGHWAAVAVTADTVHVAAMAAWLGALAVLAVCLARRDRPAGLVATLPAVSTLALTAVTTLAVTGTLQAVRQAGSFDALAATTYGRIVLLKVAGLGLLVALGRLARRSVAVGSTAEPGFVRGVRAELGVAGAVLVASAVLVAAVPARTAYAPDVVRRLQLSAVRLEVRAGPPRVGAPVHVRVSGAPGVLAGLEGSLRLPGSGLPALPLVFGAGEAMRVATVTLPAAGPWTLDLTIVAPTGGRVTLATTVPVH